jgi:hypothetical protein
MGTGGGAADWGDVDDPPPPPPPQAASRPRRPAQRTRKALRRVDLIPRKYPMLWLKARNGLPVCLKRYAKAEPVDQL